MEKKLGDTPSATLNFVISGKVTSLPKVIKYVQRSKYSFHDFSAKHKPSATLI